MESTIQANTSQTALTVVEDASTVLNADGSLARQGRVVIEGNSMADVQSAPARQMAIDYGAKAGMKAPGISSTGGAYPAHAVRADGTIDESLLLQAMPDGARQRIDYTITAMI